MLVPKEFSHFVFIKFLNEGDDNTCVCHMFDTRNHREVVCKIFNRSSPDFLVIEQELRVMQSLKHNNIAPVLEIVYEEKFLVIVTKHFRNGDLLEVIQSNCLSYEMYMTIMTQVIDAICFLHSKGIAHLDIKPENILMDENMVPKLADFGCCETPESRKYIFRGRGTIAYISPEVIMEKGTDHRPADVWALGILLYVVVTHHFPWNYANKTELVESILTKEIVFPDLFPSRIQKIVVQATKKNPAERITAKEMLDEIKKYTPAFRCATLVIPKNIPSFPDCSKRKKIPFRKMTPSYNNNSTFLNHFRGYNL